eukprot:scaffold1386_cov72-Phaeocystis_antarctica.AAC.2
MACCQSAARAARSCDPPPAARPRPVAASEPPAGGRLHWPAARSGASASNGGVSSRRLRGRSSQSGCFCLVTLDVSSFITPAPGRAFELETIYTLLPRVVRVFLAHVTSERSLGELLTSAG